MIVQKKERYEVIIPDTLDLAERAKLGLNHFTELIEEKLDYEMYYNVNFDYQTPVIMAVASSLHGGQWKALEAMAMLRLMSGSNQHLDREVKMVEMLISLIGEDGLFWTPFRDDKPWVGKEFGAKEPYAYVFAQGRMLYAMLAWHQYTGDDIWKPKIDKLVNGIEKLLVVHKEDYAYIPTHGMGDADYVASCYPKSSGWRDTDEPVSEKRGEEGSLFNHQGLVPGALANCYLFTGNEKALRLAGELVRFLIKPKFWGGLEYGNGLKEYPGVKGEEHAHWWGHYHGHINVLRSILEYAIAANDARLKTFVRDGYEWARRQWLSRLGFCAVADGQGCGCGRLIGLAVKLTYAGIGDYWEDIDGYIRNHGTEMQFTEDDIDYLLEVSKNSPPLPRPDILIPPRVDKDIKRVTKSIIGGFGGNPAKVFSAHCCSTHGNMGLFYAWDGTLRFNDGVAKVNLLLNRVSPWMDIDSYLPYEGKVVIKNKTAKEAFVRIPLWVNRKELRCHLNKRQSPAVWFDSNYLRFEKLKESDTLTIEFPVVETTEQYTITAPAQCMHKPLFGDLQEKHTVHTCKFKGNTLIEISPPLPSLPPLLPLTQLYKNRGHYRATKAPMKKVERYVTDKILQW